METPSVCIDGWVVDKENVYMYNGILFNLKKESSPAICDSMYEPGGHYAKWNKSEWERQLHHSYVDS